jgi:hypothetical protein
MTKQRRARPPATSRMGRLPRPPRNPARVSIAPKGPRIYHRTSSPTVVSAFTTPPPGFVTPHTSKTEWMVYLALALITGKPKNPFARPFIGGPPLWIYQKIEEGGRVPGGSVSDFVVLNFNGTAQIGIRVETERYHIWTDAAQQQKDIYIASHLQTVNKIVRIYDQHFIDDPTGEKVCRVVALAMRGIELPSPIFFGTAQRVRP